MTAQYLTWRRAIGQFADDLIRFQELRSRGLDVVQAATELGMSVDAAAVYERTNSRLMAGIQNEAAPGPTLHGRPAAAPQKAHDTEKGIAP